MTAEDVAHFCSIRCATIWAEWAGYHKPPSDDVLDAEIYCGAKSESGSDCRFPDSHPGDHVSYRGEVWTDA